MIIASLFKIEIGRMLNRSVVVVASPIEKSYIVRWLINFFMKANFN